MAKITINDYKIGNNIIKPVNTLRYVISLWGDETELDWKGNINKRNFKNFKELRKIYIDTENCSAIYADEIWNAPFLGCSPKCRIFTNATSKPDTWGKYFNLCSFKRSVDKTGTATISSLEYIPVTWNATKANYTEYTYEE